ncbi:hypothetical protein L1887_57248 [Cichorium endivia]|nr:hypothetical protein L1887_57248 [Cichorium endivia]
MDPFRMHGCCAQSQKAPPFCRYNHQVYSGMELPTYGRICFLVHCCEFSSRSRRPWTSSRPSSEDSKGFSLKDAFKRLSIRARSSSPACDAQHKPASTALPRPASHHKAATSASTAVSLPPYLAHLAASTRPHLSQGLFRSHESASQPQHLLHMTMTSSHTYAATTSGFYVCGAGGSSPPRTNRHQADTRQASLQPTSTWDVHSKQPATARSKHHAKTTQEPINLVTPPRAPGKLRQKSPSPSTPLGARTPNGSQRDPSCPPVRGQCWGIKQDGTPLHPQGPHTPAHQQARTGRHSERTKSIRARRVRTAHASPSDWFGTVELSEHAQALLRRAMSRPPTDFDRAEQGYIYIYELRDRSSATHSVPQGRTYRQCVPPSGPVAHTMLLQGSASARFSSVCSRPGDAVGRRTPSRPPALYSAIGGKRSYTSNSML